MKRVEVSSSMIAAIGYDEQTEAMTVFWNRGTQTDYGNVPKEVFEKFVSAPSVGQFYNQNIKGNQNYTL